MTGVASQVGFWDGSVAVVRLQPGTAPSPSTTAALEEEGGAAAGSDPNRGLQHDMVLLTHFQVDPSPLRAVAWWGDAAGRPPLTPPCLATYACLLSKHPRLLRHKAVAYQHFEERQCTYTGGQQSRQSKCYTKEQPYHQKPCHEVLLLLAAALERSAGCALLYECPTGCALLYECTALASHYWKVLPRHGCMAVEMGVIAWPVCD